MSRRQVQGSRGIVFFRGNLALGHVTDPSRLLHNVEDRVVYRAPCCRRARASGRL